MSASPLPERFSLEGQIASGGMGVVYAATDRATGARVAVKVLHQGLVDDARFERESASLAALADDCIVRYVAHGRAADGRPFLAMEWLEGEDLASRLARGPLSGDETLVLAKRLARGLEVVHTAGLVHRDVKPENVFLVNGELSRAKLLDFGLARRPRLDVVTALGRIVGTPAYMAPEQIRGQVPDPRVDVFALGCVLYHALAGAPPFTGGNTLQLQHSGGSTAATFGITFSHAVNSLAFTIIDVDASPTSAWIDRVTVTSDGSPTLTAGSTNTISGLVATGNASAGNDTSAGAVGVTIPSATTFGLSLSNAAGANNHGIALRSVAWCEP